MRRFALLLAVGSLVVLAGCSGALSGGDSTPTLDQMTYPDGVSENETNLSTLADTHVEALNDSSYTVEVNTSEEYETRNVSANITSRVESNPRKALVNISAGSETSYITNETLYTKRTQNGDSRYEAIERSQNGSDPLARLYTGSGFIGQLNAEANFTPTGVRTVDGTPLVVLEPNETTVDMQGVNVTEYNATILVDERGVVHRFDRTLGFEMGNSSVRSEISMNVTKLNETTVEKPSWLDEARNQSSKSTRSANP